MAMKQQLVRMVHMMNKLNKVSRLRRKRTDDIITPPINTPHTETRFPLDERTT